MKRILLYQDNEKALYQQGAFYILFEKTPNIDFNQGGTGTKLFELPDWYKSELRNQIIGDILNDKNRLN